MGNILHLPVLQICEHGKKNVCENTWKKYVNILLKVFL